MVRNQQHSRAVAFGHGFSPKLYSQIAGNETTIRKAFGTRKKNLLGLERTGAIWALMEEHMDWRKGIIWKDGHT